MFTAIVPIKMSLHLYGIFGFFWGQVEVQNTAPFEMFSHGDRFSSEKPFGDMEQIAQAMDIMGEPNSTGAWFSEVARASGRKTYATRTDAKQ